SMTIWTIPPTGASWTTICWTTTMTRMSRWTRSPMSPSPTRTDLPTPPTTKAPLCGGFSFSASRLRHNLRSGSETAIFPLAPRRDTPYTPPTRAAPDAARTSGGAIAQLVERLNGIQEVRGSTPLGSTNKIKDLDRKRHCSPSRILLWGNIRGNTPTPLIVKPALRGGGLTHTRLKGDRK